MSAQLETFSSGEEQQLTRNTKKVVRKTTGLFARTINTPHTAPPSLEHTQTHAVIAVSQKLHSFEDLIRSETHLSLNTPDDQCGLIALKRSARPANSKNKDTIATGKERALKKRSAESTEEHEKRVRSSMNVDPWASRMLKERLQALPRPIFFPRDISLDMAEEKMKDALRRRQLELVLLKSDFEQELLQESGTFKCADGVTRTFPACSFGNKCVCTVLFDRIQPLSEAVDKTPFVCTSMFYPDQYAEFWASGKLPQDTTPCILCCRKTLADAIIHTRLSNITKTEEEAAKMPENSGTIFVKKGYAIYQMYRNLFNEPGGYFRDYALIMRPDEAIVDSIVLLNLSMLRMRADPSNKRRVVDQSFIMWKSVPVCVPRVGERESVF